MSGVLLLGGTSEARDIARQVTVISSLAGRVSNPVLPRGEVRVGGFGGVAGLLHWLQDNEISAVVDATHPFAHRITAHAVAACRQLGLPLLRVERPGWQPAPGWHLVDSLDEAASSAATLGERVFLTTGRQGLEAFAALPGWALVRCVDPPTGPLPLHHELLLARGPYDADDEEALMRDRAVDVLVTKDSGGDLTAGKLEAARRLGIPVVVVRRPAPEDVETVHSVEEAVAWVRRHAA